MDEELRAHLEIDLSTLTPRMRETQAQADQADKNVESVQRKSQEVTARASGLERIIGRIEHKLSHLGRSVLRTGLAAGVAEGLSGLGGGDSGVLGALGNIGSATIAGAAFGGPPGAVFAAAITTIHEIKRGFQEHEKRIIELHKFLRDQEARIQDREAARQAEEWRRERELKKELYEFIRDAKKEGEELAYQTMRFMALEDKENNN